MGDQKNLFEELVSEGFTELAGPVENDDHLFEALRGGGGFSVLDAPRRKAKPKHYRTEFVCHVCAQPKNGQGIRFCDSCNIHLGRIMAVYTEAAQLIPSVRKMKLSEFVERLWQREKERRIGKATQIPTRRKRGR